MAVPPGPETRPFTWIEDSQSSFDSCDGLWSSPAPLGQAPTSLLVFTNTVN